MRFRIKYSGGQVGNLEMDFPERVYEGISIKANKHSGKKFYDSVQMQTLK